MPPPSHVDLSVLWVPIMPETSGMDAAMKDAAKGAKDTFEENTKDIGAPIDESLEKTGSKVKERFKDWGHSIRDTFHKAGKDSADDFGEELEKGTKSKTKGVADELGEIFGSTIGRAIGEKLHQIPIVDQLATSFKGVASAVQDIRAGNLGGILGDVSGVLKGLEPIASTFGADISSWPSAIQNIVTPAQNMARTLGAAKDNVSQLSTLFGNFEKDAPGIEGALGRIGSAAADAFSPLIAAGAAVGPLQKWMQEHGVPGSQGPGQRGGSDWTWDFTHPWDAPGKANAWWPFHHDWDANHPSTPPGPPPDTGTLGDAGSALPAPPSALGGAGSTLPMPNAPSGSGLGGAGALTPGASHYAAPAMPAPSVPPASFVPPSLGGSVSSRADLHAQGSNIANLYALAASMEGTPYSQALRNDCSGAVSRLASAALGLPDPAAGQRFSTVNEGDWLMSHGFRPGMGPAGSLRIGWYDHGGGNAGHTAATLPGGEHAESGGSHGAFLVGPGAAGAENPEFDHHAWLPMDGSAAAAFAASGSGGAGAGPRGSQHDPLYVTQADTGSGGSSPTQNQGEQLGQGMVNGMLQAVGLDGSVFKGFGGSSNPLQFGITKLATGLLNWGMGTFGGHGSAGSLSAGLGGGGGPSIGGLGALIPGAGGIPMSPSTASGGVPVGLGGAQNVPSGNTTIINGDVNSGFNVTQHGVQSPTEDLQGAANAGRSYAMGTANNAGILPK